MTQETPLLSGRQEAFAQHFAANYDMAKAYAQSYDATGKTKEECQRLAYRVMESQRVKDRIRELRNEAGHAIGIGRDQLALRLLAMANVDPGEIFNLRRGACRYCHGLDHAYQWRTQREYFEELEAAQDRNAAAPPSEREDLPLPTGGFGYDHTISPDPQCPECCGDGATTVTLADTGLLSPAARSLIAGIKHTKEGPEIKLHDQLRVLDMLAKLLGLNADPKVTATVAITGAVASLTAEPQDGETWADAYARMRDAVG